MRAFHHQSIGKSSKLTEIIPLTPSTKDSIWWKGFIKSLFEAKKLLYKDLSSFKSLCEKAQNFIELFQSDPNSRSWIKSLIPYQYDLLAELIKQKEDSAKNLFDLINKNIEIVKLSLKKTTKSAVTTKLLDRHIRNYKEIEMNLEQWKKIYGDKNTVQVDSTFFIPLEVCSLSQRETSLQITKCVY
jgi:hypothetical protein